MSALIDIFPDVEFFPKLQQLQIGPRLYLSDLWAPLETCGGKCVPWIPIPLSILPKITSIIIDSIPQKRRQAAGFTDRMWPDCHGVLRILLELGPQNTLQEFDFHSNIIEQLDGPREMYYFAFPNYLGEILTNHTITLRHLKVPATPSPSDYSVLASLTRLETLELGQEERLPSELWKVMRGSFMKELVTGRSTFPGLRTLICRHRAISGMLATMLETVELPTLNRFDMDGVDRVEDARYLPTFLRELGQRVPTLIDISIDLSLKSVESTLLKKFGPDIVRLAGVGQEPSSNRPKWPNQPPPARSVVVRNDDVIPILGNCSQLRSFKVTCPHSTPDLSVVFELTNEILTFIADQGERWSSPLEHLTLDPSQTSPSGRITLEGLVPLGQSCPNLTTLEIGLNTEITHYVYASAMYLDELQGGLPSNVTHINLGAPLVQSTAACAEFLRCVFPKLESVSVPSHSSAKDIFDPSGARMFAWSKVTKAVKESSAVGEGGKPVPDPSVKEVDTVMSSFNDDEDGYYYDSQEEGGEEDEG